MTLYAERLLPHNIEAEEALIGSLLIDGDCIARVAPMLRPRDFYRERNQLCYDAAIALSHRNQAIDQITLASELERTEKLDLVGGMAYLSHLVANTPTSVHSEDYAEIVSRTATMRKLISAGAKITELGYSETDDLARTLRQAEDALYAVSNTTQRSDFQSFRDIFDRYLQEQASVDDLLLGTAAPDYVRIRRPGRGLGRLLALRPGHPRGPPLGGKEHPWPEHRHEQCEGRPHMRHLLPRDDGRPARNAGPGRRDGHRLPPPPPRTVQPGPGGAPHRRHRPSCRSCRSM